MSARRSRTDLELAAALTLAGLVAAALLPDSLGLLRLLLAGPLVLILPGFTLARATLPPGDLQGGELFALSVALSVVTTILSALALDALAVKLTIWPWIAILAFVTLVGAAIAARRGHAQPLRQPAFALGRGEQAVLAVALVLVAAAAAVGSSALPAPQRTDGTTALWILPTHPVKVGVTSDETHDTTYTVAVTLAGRPLRNFGPFTLAPGASWSRLVAVGAGKPAVVARLTVAGEAAATRTAALQCWCTSVRSSAAP